MGLLFGRVLGGSLLCNTVADIFIIQDLADGIGKGTDPVRSKAQLPVTTNSLQLLGNPAQGTPARSRPLVKRPMASQSAWISEPP